MSVHVILIYLCTVFSSVARKTIAVGEETYRLLTQLKRRMGCRTMDETIRRLVELSKLALALEVLDYVRGKRLSRGELELLAELRGKLREEAAWLRRS